MQLTNTIQALSDQFGDRASRNRDVLDRHGRDESFHAPAPPDLVVFPDTNEEVASIVRQCADSGTPVIPYGVGTSLEGHVAALHGGVCVDLSMMNKVLELNPADLAALTTATFAQILQ